VVFRPIIGLYKLLGFLRFFTFFKIHFCRISYVFSSYVQRHTNLPFSPFKLRVRAMHSDDVCVIMTGRPSDSPTQRCSADVASLGPERFLRTQVTFLYIYGHVHVHVCTELEDRSPDKSQYVSYSRYVLRICYVGDVDRFDCMCSIKTALRCNFLDINNDRDV